MVHRPIDRSRQRSGTRREAPQHAGSQQSKTRGGAAGIAEEIAAAAAQRPFESLDELNDFTRQLMKERNQKARDEFCGLSPVQMAHLLYAPFSSAETVTFSTAIAPGSQVGIMRLFMLLADAVGDSGLKATATGNLPLKFCKAVAQRLQKEDDGTDWLLVGGIRSESDLEILHCTRLVAELAGLIRKYRGQFVLTRKCQKMLEREDSGGLYFELFKAYTTKFDWAYRDGYLQAELVQHSFLYTLFLLASFGAEHRSQQFYEDKFLTAFPMALEMFPETAYSTADDSARRCYFLRALHRFAVFFGLAELVVESKELYRVEYGIRKSELLDRFVTFRV